MHVIRHKAVAKHADSILITVTAEEFEIILPVFVFAEYGLPRVAALGNMVRGARYD